MAQERKANDTMNDMLFRRNIAIKEAFEAINLHHMTVANLIDFLESLRQNGFDIAEYPLKRKDTTNG